MRGDSGADNILRTLTALSISAASPSATSASFAPVEGLRVGKLQHNNETAKHSIRSILRSCRTAERHMTNRLRCISPGAGHPQALGTSEECNHSNGSTAPERGSRSKRGDEKNVAKTASWYTHLRFAADGVNEFACTVDSNF